MVGVRSHLSWVIAGWLVCQFASVAAPLALYAAITPSSGHDKECDCPIAPGQVCPMHHTNEGARTGEIRNASGGSEATFLAQAGEIGLLPHHAQRARLKKKSL